MHDYLWQGPELTFPFYEKWWKLLWWERCKCAGVGKSQKGLHVSSPNVKKAQKIMTFRKYFISLTIGRRSLNALGKNVKTALGEA